MKNVLRIVAGLVGVLFFLNGLQWSCPEFEQISTLGDLAQQELLSKLIPK